MDASYLVKRAAADTKLLATYGSRVAAVAALVATLALPLDPALAARGGGRVGGSSFRSAPSMRAAPRSGYSGGGGIPGGYGGGYYGAGPSVFMSPFFLPFGGFGLGGFGSLFLFASAAAFLYDAVRTKTEEGEYAEAVDPVTAVTVLKVGLLASARELQVSLDALGRSADTTSISGLRYVLGETVTALLRHPDFWMYGSSNVQQARLSKAEGEFNKLSLEERLKLDEETLTNAGGRQSELERASATTTDLGDVPNEYIVVSLVVAAAGDLITRMPKTIDSTADLDRALRALAGVTEDSLQGVEVVWAPQSLKDSLTERQLLADHPELKRL